MRAPGWLRRRMIEDMAVASWGPMRFEARLRAASASRHSSTACPTRSPRRVRTGGTANRYELVEKISRGPCYAPATGKMRHGVYAFLRKDRQVPRPRHLRSGRKRSSTPDDENCQLIDKCPPRHAANCAWLCQATPPS